MRKKVFRVRLRSSGSGAKNRKENEMKRPAYRFNHGRPAWMISTGVIAVDVDNTLIGAGGRPNDRLIEWLRDAKADGKDLILWSARGGDHARQHAERLGIADLFDVIIGKPEMSIDDDLWKWTRFSSHVHPSVFDDSFD